MVPVPPSCISGDTCYMVNVFSPLHNHNFVSIHTDGRGRKDGAGGQRRIHEEAGNGQMYVHTCTIYGLKITGLLFKPFLEIKLEN